LILRLTSDSPPQVHSKKTSVPRPLFDYIHRRPSLRGDTANSWDPIAPKLISGRDPTTRSGRGCSARQRPGSEWVRDCWVPLNDRPPPSVLRARDVVVVGRSTSLTTIAGIVCDGRGDAVGRRLPIRRRFRDVHVAVIENLTLSSSTAAATTVENGSTV